MVVRVVVVLPLVVLYINMVLVNVLAHIDIGEDILQLGVVVERDRREWVEVVWIYNLSLGHCSHLSIFNGLVRLHFVGLVDSEV